MVGRGAGGLCVRFEEESENQDVVTLQAWRDPQRSPSTCPRETSLSPHLRSQSDRVGTLLTCSGGHSRAHSRAVLGYASSHGAFVTVPRSLRRQ